MSERLKFKGDYMGFTYNGKHSSEFGIVRVSDGSRFNENLLPTMQDKTVQIPGGDGTYYFGSYYTQRQFSVSFAFDALTENELAELKRHFGDKGVHDLIFDEAPYKVWSAKVTGTATIKYVPFDEGNTHRLYKGEGSIQFTCFYPFARCYSTNLEDYGINIVKNVNGFSGDVYYYDADKKLFVLKSDDTPEVLGRTYYSNIGNANEWIAASRIMEDGNFGDVDAPFKLEIDGEGSIQTDNGFIKWKFDDDNIFATLDTKTGVVKTSTGLIMNKYVSGDLTMKIPVGATMKNITITKIGSTTNNADLLTYNRLYF